MWPARLRTPSTSGARQAASSTVSGIMVSAFSVGRVGLEHPTLPLLVGPTRPCMRRFHLVLAVKIKPPDHSLFIVTVRDMYNHLADLGGGGGRRPPPYFCRLSCFSLKEFSDNYIKPWILGPRCLFGTLIFIFCAPSVQIIFRAFGVHMGRRYAPLSKIPGSPPDNVMELGLVSLPDKNIR